MNDDSELEKLMLAFALDGEGDEAALVRRLVEDERALAYGYRLLWDLPGIAAAAGADDETVRRIDAECSARLERLLERLAEESHASDERAEPAESPGAVVIRPARWARAWPAALATALAATVLLVVFSPREPAEEPLRLRSLAGSTTLRLQVDPRESGLPADEVTRALEGKRAALEACAPRVGGAVRLVLLLDDGGRVERARAVEGDEQAARCLVEVTRTAPLPIPMSAAPIELLFTFDVKEP